MNTQEKKSIKYQYPPGLGITNPRWKECRKRTGGGGILGGREVC